MDAAPLNELQTLVLNHFPHPIAINYKRALDGVSYQDKARQAMLVFDFTVRAVALSLISQYLLYDREKIDDSLLNALLKSKLPRPTLGSWVEITFTILRVYKDHRDLLFMEELYDAYWDPRRAEPRKGIRGPFDQMVMIRNRLAHELPPQDEAGWQVLFQEIHPLLLQVFDTLRFLANYELIYIIRQEGDRYFYQRYCGQDISIAEEPLQKVNGESLGDGWFYLTREQNKSRMLKLYPFLIAWEKDTDLELSGSQNDAALLDKFSNSRVYYLATVLWESFARQDDALLADFFYNFKRTLEMKRLEEKLSWERLKDISNQITEQNMGDAVKKYNPELYLEREEVRRVFDDFLASDKTGLVITGKSGVGKTNFVMATLGVLQSDAQVCALAYNGARLPAEGALADLLQADLQKFIELPLLSAETPDLWTALSQNPDIAHKKLIIFIDAINENPQASDVVQRLDWLVGRNLHPWLKIVVTSRPEAWRMITYELKLSELQYYWCSGEDEMGVQLQEFRQTDPDSLAIQIEKFSRNEVQQAYQKYKAVFGLLTDYTDLPVEIRKMLQDPLIMRLVAEIHRNKAIPATIRIDQIYADYVKALEASKRLYPEDVAFLRYKIIPRMANKQDNALTEDEVLTDNELYELIFNTDTISNGQPVNRSFQRLVDAEILASLPEIGEVAISFKYERFYDHFMGEHFYLQYHDKADAQANYQELVASIRTHPFLWGAVKNALVKELDEDKEDLLYALSCQPDHGTRELIIAALTEFGLAQADQTSILSLIQRMFSAHKSRRKGWKWLKSLLPGQPTEELEEVAQSLAKIALEVALNLKKAGILDDAAKDPSEIIRMIAIRNIYHFWLKDPQAGFALLDQLADQTSTNIGLPRIPVLESCLGISILMMRHYQPTDPIGQEVGTRLLTIWRRVIRRLLFVSKDEAIGRRMFRGVIRSIVVHFVIQFIVSTQKNYPATRPSFLRDTNAFFTADDSVKQNFRQLVNFFVAPGEISSIRQNLVDAIDANDALTSSLVWFLFVPQARVEFEEAISLLEEMARITIEQPKVGMFAAPMTTGMLYIVMHQPEVHDDLFMRCQNLLMKYIDRTHYIFYSNDGGLHSNPAMGEYITILRRRRSPSDLNLCSHYLAVALNEKDNDFLDRQFLDLPVLADVFNGPQYVLEALEQLFPLPDDPVLQDKLSTVLSKIRAYHTEMVDEFLFQYDQDKLITDKVIRQESREQPWIDLVHVSVGSLIIRLIETPVIRQEVAKILTLATEHSNLQDYLKAAITRAINLISGANVLGDGS